MYALHAILCHNGTLDSGHYFCYLRVGSGMKFLKEDSVHNLYDDGRWLKFDDNSVT